MITTSSKLKCVDAALHHGCKWLKKLDIRISNNIEIYACRAFLVNTLYITENHLKSIYITITQICFFLQFVRRMKFYVTKNVWPKTKSVIEFQTAATDAMKKIAKVS